VEAHASRDEEGLLSWESPGISFGDYENMQTQHVKIEKARRYEAPSFAVNDRDLRLVVVHAVERRAYGSSKRLLDEARHSGLSLVDRMKRAEDLCRARADRVGKTLDKCCAEYVELRGKAVPTVDGGPCLPKEALARMGQLQTIIQSLDGQLRIDSHPAEVLTFIAYHYFRCGATSNQIASGLGLGAGGAGGAACVRQILFRMCRVAKQELGFDLGVRR